MVENIETCKKFMITSIDKIYTMNMEIEAQCIQFKKSFKTKKSTTHKCIMDEIFALTHVMGMTFSMN
jgi:hypothetical protein